MKRSLAPAAPARTLLARLAPVSPRGREAGVSGRSIWTLAVGVIGLTWSLTTVAAYLPPVLQRFTHSHVLIGVILGAEGLVAVSVPLLVGPLSDRTRTRMGRRSPYMLAALPAMAATLVMVTLSGGLWPATVVLLVFFCAYYLYETPYRSLYPDRLPRSVEGRAQSVQHLLRGVAIGGALVLGGVLFDVSKTLPFVLAAAVVVVTGLAAVRLVDEPPRPRRTGAARGLGAPWRILRGNPTVRSFLVANTAWELTFAGMRTFVVLYITKGLHQPIYVSTAVLATVAMGYVVAAAAAGRLGDRVGTARVIAVASVVYGCGLATGVLPHRWHWVFLALVFVVAVAAGTVMTLAWSLLFKLMPARDRGSVSGLASTTKGLGLLIGPAAAGGAIDLARGALAATDGYAIMWPVLAVPILAVLPLVVRLGRAERRRGQARSRR